MISVDELISTNAIIQSNASVHNALSKYISFDDISDTQYKKIDAIKTYYDINKQSCLIYDTLLDEIKTVNKTDELLNSISSDYVTNKR